MTAHCESCGSTDREDLSTGDQGYTACCNELVCDGTARHRFGDETTNVPACCWAEAEKVFAARGIEIPERAWRLS